MVQSFHEMAEKEVAVVPLTPKNSWKGWLWDSADVSKEERKFLLKVIISYRLSRVPCSDYTFLFAVGLHAFDIWYAWDVDQMGKHNAIPPVSAS